MIDIRCGNALDLAQSLPDASVHCIVTSPPYWGLRDYRVKGQIGLERTPERYVDQVVRVFDRLRTKLRDEGTLWLNLGDRYISRRGGDIGATSKINGKKGHVAYRAAHAERSYDGAVTGLKHKDLVGMPWRVALALQADGWYLRCDIVWHKPNPMPESVTDRPTKAHEYVFLLAKAERYYFDAEAVKVPAAGTAHPRSSGWAKGPGKHTAIAHAREKLATDKSGGNRKYNASYDAAIRMTVTERNIRSVWTIPSHPFPEAHFATFPEKLVEPCILAGCPEGGVVLDPFMGAGTVALVALKARRNFLGIELNPKYAAMAERRIAPELAQGRLA